MSFGKSSSTLTSLVCGLIFKIAPKPQTANQIFPGTAGEHSVIWMHNGSAANDLSLGRAGGVTDIDINSLRLERILERA